MAYSGKYPPLNPKKYKGDPRMIIYRSLWELKFMKWCDTHNHILEWGSEEIVVPYRSPLDGRVHRYFPDFYIKVKNKNGILKKYIIEIKPKSKHLNQRNQKEKPKTISQKLQPTLLIKRNGKQQENGVWIVD